MKKHLLALFLVLTMQGSASERLALGISPFADPLVPLDSPKSPVFLPDYEYIMNGVNPDVNRLAVRSVQALHAEQKVLNNVVPITWRGGCVPTAATMNLYHWEKKGFTKVFGPMRQRREPKVLTEIQDATLLSASEEHMRDYFYPTDTFENLLPDRSGYHHVTIVQHETLGDVQVGTKVTYDYKRQPNCLADWLGTSMAFWQKAQGATWSGEWAHAAVSWLQRVAPDYYAKMTVYNWEHHQADSPNWQVLPDPTTSGWVELHSPDQGDGRTYDRSYKWQYSSNRVPSRDLWQALKDAIDSGRSVVASTNSKAGRGIDHAILVVGYKQDSEGKKYYAAYNTWSAGVIWYEFVPLNGEGTHPAFAMAGFFDLEISLKDGATPSHFAAGVLHEFYNLRTGAYFFTGSSDEAAYVYNNPNWKYQGPAFHIESEPDAGKGKPKNVPVYRFFNSRSRSHFYTASSSERDNVIRDLGHTYSYEGIAFYARTWEDKSKLDRPVHRFYVHPTASHFFSANPVQVEHLKRFADPKYITYEGVAWFAPRAAFLIGPDIALDVHIREYIKGDAWRDVPSGRFEDKTGEGWVDYSWIPGP